MIPREHAQSAGVLRERFVDGELGAEVGNGELLAFVGAGEPGFRLQILIELGFDACDFICEIASGRQVGAALGRKHFQRLDGIVVRRFP